MTKPTERLPPNNWTNAGLSSYAYNAQVFPVDWNGYHRFPASITDGTSNTIFFTEQAASNCGWWYDWGPSIADGSWPQPTGPAAMFVVQPPASQVGNYGSGSGRAVSPHTSGITVGMGDGSVRFIGQGISGNTWWWALTPANGEVLGPDW